MRRVVRAKPLAHGGRDEDETFYGWRYVRRVRPAGTEVVDEIPLTFEDLLYPEESDFAGTRRCKDSRRGGRVCVVSCASRHSSMRSNSKSCCILAFTYSDTSCRYAGMRTTFPEPASMNCACRPCNWRKGCSSQTKHSPSSRNTRAVFWKNMCRSAMCSRTSKQITRSTDASASGQVC